VCRSLWAGSTRVNFERVCDSLDGPRGDGIWETERAEWQSMVTVGQVRTFATRFLRRRLSLDRALSHPNTESASQLLLLLS
jgi:hypothetical protein